MNPSVDQSSFAFEPIYGSLVLAIVMVAVTVAVILWVTPPNLSTTKRRWLIALRLLAAMILVVAVLRPALIRTDKRAADAAVVVAIDTSKSMTLPDGQRGIRFDTQQNAASQLIAGLQQVDASLSVQVIAYDETARRISPAVDANDAKLPALQPLGKATDLSAAAMATITATEGQPIAGVVLFGDGTQTAPVVTGGASQVARTLNSLGVPLWAVPIGPAAGDGESRDVAVESLNDRYQLFAGNQVDIDFQIVTRGFSGIDIPVRLMWVASDGKTKEVAVRRARSQRANDAIAMTVGLTAPDPGTYRLIVQADQQDGETITMNNQQIAFVDVREGGGRVLYIEGSLRQEYVFIRRSLRRFPDLDLTARWIPRDTKNSWPVDLPGSFEAGKFDVFVLGDVEAAALGREQLQQLALAVDAGAGLVMIGGRNTFGGGGYANSPLAGVLPIEMVTNGKTNQIEGPVPLSLSRSHPITDLGGGRPEDVWQSLPDQLGANRFEKQKVAAGVATLLTSENDQPMLVVGSHGRGRVAALAFDSTYRWWRAGKSESHRRFWRQLILWLLSREETDEDKILIEMDQRRFASDKRPQFRATLDATNGDDAEPSLVAEVIGEEGGSQIVTTTRLESSVGGVGIRGDIPELVPGIYQLRVRSTGADESLEADPSSMTELAFQVIDQSLELSRPMADPVFMQQLASQTADQGGRSFRPDEMNELLQTIAERRKRAEIPVIEKNRLGDGPLTGWPMFLVFAGALSTEWYLRRRWNLA